ncbi:hypothetical protein SKAU_G00297650 [Synaphobranchus kaupii]|uniref:Uncharacterized protein n=1 Tax=Synaphobranchus kaupii TaxID=118154 RepID=A0A9Q1EV49_SYNKA|nr:hypothetical protein SKAU_G00297650 [Synaphobranchus kaupii]
MRRAHYCCVMRRSLRQDSVILGEKHEAEPHGRLRAETGFGRRTKALDLSARKSCFTEAAVAVAVIHTELVFV